MGRAHRRLCAPGRTAREPDIAALERFHSRTLPADYRTFLACHDGWEAFAWETWLRATKQLHGKAYTRGFIDSDWDEPLPPELDEAIVIGASVNDASVVMLLANGEVVDWLYEETGRAPSFLAYLEEPRDTLCNTIAAGDAARARVVAEWDRERRAERDAMVEAETAQILANAPHHPAVQLVPQTVVEARAARERSRCGPATFPRAPRRVTDQRRSVSCRCVLGERAYGRSHSDGGAARSAKLEERSRTVPLSRVVPAG